MQDVPINKPKELHLNMLKAQKVYWLAQAGGWALLSTLILTAGINNPNSDPKAVIPVSYLVIYSVFFFFSGVILSHGMRYLFISWGWLEMRLGPLIPRVLLMSLGIATLMAAVDVVASELISPSKTPFNWFHFVLDSSTTSIFFLLWNGMYFAFHFFQKSRVQEVKNLQLSASQNEIELKNLRSQLNPHFLFNSLNSIRALVDIDPSQAKENITTLANLLRKSLILGKEQLVPLKDELDLVNDYLDLEKVRFEERLAIVIKHDERLNDLPVPPFIVQTLVENAFKHGISRLIEGGTIMITSAVKADVVSITVTNDGKLGDTVDTGIGLQNTLRRLELQYGPNAIFTLKQSGGKVKARIELKQQVL